jgi:hypothetical protein
MLATDRVSLALFVVFLLVSVFYLLTAATSMLLALHDQPSEPYNRLATAFLHLHLSVGPAPAALQHLAEPYNPAQNMAIQTRFSIHDFAVYHGKLFLTWGPAPVVVLLVPMRLLGFEPSASVVVAIFAIVGFGFVLATLRVLLRQIGSTTIWMCVLAALALALSSAVSYILRRPAVYEEAVAGGYCFTMVGIWLVFSALADRRASLWRLALMSLCFGLATGSRPTLGLTAFLLVPVYMSLRSTRPRPGLLMSLLIPVGGCFLLLAAYNQARFGSPLNWGEQSALTSDYSHIGHWAQLGNVLPNAWLYIVSPPRPLALFPFIRLGPPPVTYPGTLPVGAQSGESTGGLLPMTPILIFLAALPWVWRRRPGLFGPLSAPLLVLAAAGLICLLFFTYQFYATTERYEVDFTTPLLLGALAAWLALCRERRRRRLTRICGCTLIVWGCATGLAISFTGTENLLATTLPGSWTTFENIGAPVSTAIVAIAGHPVLAEVSAPNLAPFSDVRYTSLSDGLASFWLSPTDQADLTIVSPDFREATLVARVLPGPALRAGASLWAVISTQKHVSYSYRLPAGGGVLRMPIKLDIGVNRLVLSSLASALRLGNPGAPNAQPLVEIKNLSLASSS